MGCDGGTIPRRDELVRTKKKPEQKDKEAEREFRWRHCALTQQQLQEPVVMCALGRLYTKQSVIEHLLEKEMPESASHIKSMKDIKQINLTENPVYVKNKEKKGGAVESCAPYICKLIGLEMSGNFRFMALWTCGCVMSERAFKQIKGNICVLCQTPFSVEDVIVLNGNDDDVEMMFAKKEIRAAKLKKSKKSKGKKQLQQEEEPATSSNSDSTNSSDEIKQKPEEILNVEPSTSKAVANTEVIVVNKPTIKPTATKRPTANRNETLEDPELKRLKVNYSVSKDPKASDVYKSLFTSHSSEKEQSRAHWVTYNPFYN